MKFLIVDDDASILTLLEALITDHGDECISFKKSRHAVEFIKNKEERFDIAILDILMPGYNGLEVAKIIREEREASGHLPILFLTGTEKEELLKECLDCGDDVILKPISTALAEAKIIALKKTFTLYHDLKQKQQELESHHHLLEEERFLTQEVFNHLMQMSDLSSGNLQFHSSPSSTFNGDTFLAVRSPMDTLYVLIADITGHGLPAAIGTIPLQKIFLAMAQKGLTIREISYELNQTLYSLLPDNIFCAATIMEMSPNGEEIRMWSGAMPAIILTDEKGHYLDSIASDHMPLGSQAPSEFESNIRTINLKPGTHCYIFTDGIPEAHNEQEKMFGDEGIKAALNENPDNGFRAILEAVEKFSGKSADDDITLAEIIAQPLYWDVSIDEHIAKNTEKSIRRALPWELSMRISGQDFQRGEPISQIINIFGKTSGIDIHQDSLSTILTELYSNALEHGILQLDSELKKTEDGFIDYYLQRNDLVDSLPESDHFIDISLSFNRDGKSPKVDINITDSGTGFDYQTEQSLTNTESYGRGRTLIENLCHEFAYSNGGRTAKASYYLQ